MDLFSSFVVAALSFIFTNNRYFVCDHQGCRQFRVSPVSSPVRALMFFMGNPD